MRTLSVFFLSVFRRFERRSALSAPRSINPWFRKQSLNVLNTFFVLVSTLIVSAIAGCDNGTDPDAQPISKNPAGVAEQKPKVSVDTSKTGGLANENAKKTEAADKKTQPKIADANPDTKVEPVVDQKKEPVEPEISAKKLEETEFIED